MIQSLSIVVPNKRCINNCKFCCACMVEENYKNQMDENLPFYDLYFKNYMDRLEEAHSSGAKTIMLTGNSEPQQNRHFLMMFGLMMKLMKDPFRNIEMQTTGVMLDQNYLRFLRNHVGVQTISLSISSFDDEENFEIIGVPESLKFNLKELCDNIKKYDFNLRLSLNMNKSFNNYIGKIEDLFSKAKDYYGADQITFRVLYNSGNDTPQDKWIADNNVDQFLMGSIYNYIKSKEELKILPYGLVKYNVNGMGVVIDNDCMSKSVSKDDKYWILRPNCRLYARWDDPASLEF